VNKVLGVSFLFVLLAVPHGVSAQSGEETGSLERVREQRRKATDFNAEFYFPVEWAAADDLLERASLVDAETAFTALFDLAISLYSLEREQEILAIRAILIGQGARVFFPEFVDPADRQALLAWEQYRAGEYYRAKDSADKALAMFQVLHAAGNAWQLRQEIVTMNLAEESPDVARAADDLLGRAMSAYAIEDFLPALDYAGRAEALYTEILSAGWIELAERNSFAARAARAAAIESMANIAAVDIFVGANSLSNEASYLLRENRHKEAALLFARADVLFGLATEAALEKRRLAADAISEANRNIRQALLRMQGTEPATDKR